MCRPNVIIIGEGQTEHAALDGLLSAHLWERNLYPRFPVVGKTGGKKGGYKPFDLFVSQIRNFACQYPGAYISTCFDYYKLNTTWPHVADITNEKGGNAAAKADKIEEALTDRIYTEIGPDILWKGHFFFYSQLHEFEALLFSNPDVLGEMLDPRTPGNNLQKAFRKINDDVGGDCEMIDDGPATAPSKRIEEAAHYKKGKSDKADAGPILQEIGLPAIRQACRRFDEWVTRLETLTT